MLRWENTFSAACLAAEVRLTALPVQLGSPEMWQWSSHRSYLFGETGPVRVKFQEWPMEIKARPVETFGEEMGASVPLVRGGPLIRKERE